MKVENQSQVQVTQNTHRGLQEGSSVRGRVISANPDGSYKISLAGQMLNVSSKVPLEAGSVFQARLSVAENKILLQLLNTAGTENLLQNFYPEDVDNGSPSQFLKDYLSSLGLPLEGDSLRLLQFMRQNGIKFDFDRLRKIFIRNSVSKNTKKEDRNERLQAFLILEEKGIDSQVQIVDGLLYNDSSQNNQDSSDEPDFSEESGVVDFNQYLDQVKQAAVSKKAGPLTFFNSLSEGDNHWIVLPFEWDFHHGIGDIRVFYNKITKSPGKIIIRCTTDLKKYIFKLKLCNNNVRFLQIALEPPLNLENQQSLLFELKKSLQKICNTDSSVSVEIADYKTLDGFAPENEPVTVLRESV